MLRRLWSSIGGCEINNPGHSARRRPPMQLFGKLFCSWIQFVYHTFDRIVINGYLDFFRAESHVVVFFQQVRGEPIISKAVLRQRTAEYVRWIEAYAKK